MVWAVFVRSGKFVLCKFGLHMKLLNLPPLTALRAFLALAETGSAVAAGRALNVSHAAVSQQIRGLEDHMGVPQRRCAWGLVPSSEQ